MAAEHDFRDTFNQPAGDIIKEFCATEEQRNAVRELQIKLTAITIGEPGKKGRKDLFDIKTVEAANKYIANHNLAVYIEPATKIVDGKGGVPKEVPQFGSIAVEMGFVCADVMEALMLVQAAERTLQAHERSYKSYTFNQMVNCMKHHTHDDYTFKRPWIEMGTGSDIKSQTIRAQAIQHLADIVGAFTTVYGCTNEKIENAYNALYSAGIALYQQSAIAFTKLDMTALAKGSIEVVENAGKSGNLSVAATIITKGCEEISADKGFPEPFQDALREIVCSRTETALDRTVGTGEEKSV